MKKEIAFVAVGFALSEIGGFLVDKIRNKRKEEEDKACYDEQLKKYAFRFNEVFDNDTEEAMQITCSLVNTREMNNKEFRYIPKRGMPKYRFPLRDLTWAAWSWAF